MLGLLWLSGSITLLSILQFSEGFPQGPASAYFASQNQDSNDVTGTSLLPWWKTSIIYQVYPRSFKDTTGSGTGDLKGVTSKADYLKDLGIGAVWLSPIYTSPMADFGYDVSNFIDIDPIFGTLEDFDILVDEMHKRDLKVVMDFVPNHSSDEHEWFQKSLKKIEPFTDYYVWADAKGSNETGDPIPPSNRLSAFGFSAWEWSEERQQFYFHQYLNKQPDLNVRNPAVLDELDNILKFWLDRGVDGFRIDALKHLYEVEDFTLDEPVAKIQVVNDTKDYNYLDHPYVSNQPETVEATRRWRRILDTYANRAMVTEVFDDESYNIMKYYGTEEDPIAHFPLNFYFVNELMSRGDITGLNVKKNIDQWLDNMPTGKWPNWVLGSHDRSRVATRLGKELVDALNMLILLLQGTPTTYYGEEIGMEDTFVTFEQSKDPKGLNFGPEEYTKYGRDSQRSPMQWDNSLNAGFSAANDTWLPVNENYLTLNVEMEMAAPQSHLKVYKALASLRQNPIFTHGDMSFPFVNNDILAFMRTLEGEPSYLIVINTSESPLTVDLIMESVENLPQQGTVELRSVFDDRAGTAPGSNISLSSVSLLGSQGLVIKLDR